MNMFDRRQLLRTLSFGASLGAGFGAGFATLPSLALAAAATRRRLIFIIQRGAADGLSTVIPVGDPGLSAARSVLAIDGAIKLDGLFALNPALAETAKLYAGGQALFVHAVASPYRERSHFDAQNVLESGSAQPYRLKSGWLNRLVAALPAGKGGAVALSPTVPLALRGSATVASYAPSALPDASADLVARIGQMYAGDPQLHGLWDQALATRSMAGDAGDARDAAALGTLAARLMTGPGAARIAMIETSGWDTHSAQLGRMAAQLKKLDALITAAKAGLGAEWANTLAIVATEFGRTVAANGTGGSDHGTASAAILLGGTVNGGRVVADWPGLNKAALYEARDLKPTTALDRVISDAVALHFGLDPERAARDLFPEIAAGRVMSDLIRA
jgi:uncharacterized protein (DUF1501 family)